MISVILLSLVVGTNAFIVCTPELCQNAIQEPLDCPGKEIRGGGFCGCTDVCPKKEGEDCTLSSRLPFLGMPRSPPCDAGLECRSELTGMRLGMGSCQKVTKTKRETLTRCQQMHRVRQISFVIWQGMWDPKCDADGNFQPKQCDNIGQCFCVTQHMGTVLEKSKHKVTDAYVDCSGFDLTDGPPPTPMEPSSLIAS
ncbi:hypothetical protein FSP39_006284 [Pinctada imbricata]|uniref:Thyroglobulin type-1 domain-containing protein n=1 Tax=Pinctada imbricata TaxID=66713 RepID=A0AA88YL58_PINIB|nr:hypothetical protein FSP39_006284 [Pinctada imbricata]